MIISKTGENHFFNFYVDLDANNDGLVLGLSIGLSVAVVAIVCLLIVVIFWKR